MLWRISSRPEPDTTYGSQGLPLVAHRVFEVQPEFHPGGHIYICASVPFLLHVLQTWENQVASPPLFDRSSIKLFSEGSRPGEEMSLWHTSTITERAGNQFRGTGDPRTILRLIIWDLSFWCA